MDNMDYDYEYDFTIEDALDAEMAIIWNGFAFDEEEWEGEKNA